jgi:PAS domain S-box-containing protein
LQVARKRAESELATNQEQLRNLNEKLAERVEVQAQERDRLWNLSQDLLVVSDLSGVILNVNPAWASVLGWSPGDLVGRNGGWLVHPGDRERSLAERKGLATGQKTLHFENRILCKDGSYRWLSWFAVLDRGLTYASGMTLPAASKARSNCKHCAINWLMLHGTPHWMPCQRPSSMKSDSHWEQWSQTQKLVCDGWNARSQTFQKPVQP